MPLKKPLILVIEDDLELRELYEQRLSYEKFDVRLACDGKTGLEMAKTLKPDIILLDLRLPKIDGFQFLRLAKQEPAIKNIPVAVLTALWQDEDKKSAMNLGASVYMVKSETTPKQVVETIAYLLAKQKKNKDEKKEKIQLGIS